MEITTIQKYIHTTPRKLRLVADLIRQMEPNKALDILKITQKAAAKDLSKALETVLANARQAGIDTDKVGFKKIEIDESTKMRRFRAGTRGRAKPYKKRMSHIKIVLTDEKKVTKVTKVTKETKVRESKVQDKIVEVTERKETQKE